MKRHPILRNLMLDALLTAAALMVFALFHHVLPRQRQSLDIVIANPYAGQAAADRAQAEAADSAIPAAPDGGAGGESSAGASETGPDGGNASAGDTDAGGQADPSGKDASGKSSAASGVRESASGRRASSQGSGGSTGNNGADSRSSGSKRGASGGGGGGSSGDKGAMSGGKGGSALTGEAGVAEGGDADLPIAEKFAGMYSDEIIMTEDSYQSPNLSIRVTENTLDGGRVTYYLADIYARDITCIRTALAGDTYGSGYRDSISHMALLSGALAAVNGDYYGNTDEGVVIRNGVVYRANPTDCDVCVLCYDGSMRVIPGASFDLEEAVAEGAWQAWTFGPSLLDADGGAIDRFDSTGRIIAANPRTAIGCYEPGHYCLLVVDGRGESAGLTLPELSRLFESLGCRTAYNLDGGNSSIMVWQGEVLNDPSGGGRQSSDALVIREANDA